MGIFWRGDRVLGLDNANDEGGRGGNFFSSRAIFGYGYFSKNCTYILEYNIYTSSGIVSCRRFDLFIKIGK